MVPPMVKLSALFLMFFSAWQVSFAGRADGPLTPTMHTPEPAFAGSGTVVSAPSSGAISGEISGEISGAGSSRKQPPATSQADDPRTVDNWLDMMMRSMSQQNFQGTLIVRQANKIQVIKVKQGVTTDGSWQIMETLTGENQKVIRKDDKVTTIFPAKRLVTISDSVHKRPLHAILPENYRKLKQYYKMELSGQDRVANKVTQIVQMIPLDKYRYGYTFWLDRQSGMLLKCDLMDEKHQVLEQLMYSNIKLLPSAPEKGIDQRLLATYQQVNLQDKSETATKLWRADRLPAGFTLSRSVHIPSQHNHSKTYHMVFSDGMALVSVFVEARGNMKKPVLGLSSMGKVNAYSAYVNDTYITAIGEVPASTVRMIARSMRPE
ncbi:hypothetical protein MNBD_GAMMA11-1216 [hydrothermal vent metagenome]|uniref:Sigma factor RpoE negative regulatory protein RseB n=1 Tax=hydrothermal vent metagenome TaxID=652676 RepID=A0A3B0X9L3_9ZZZZ